MVDDTSAKRYRSNLQGEVDSAALYRAMAEAEPDPRLGEVYRRLAAVEEAHAEFWRKELQRRGERAGGLEPGWAPGPWAGLPVASVRNSCCRR